MEAYNFLSPYGKDDDGDEKMEERPVPREREPTNEEYHFEATRRYTPTI